MKKRNNCDGVKTVVLAAVAAAATTLLISYFKQRIAAAALNKKKDSAAANKKPNAAAVIKNSEAAQEADSDFTDNSLKLFGGLPQSVIDDLVKDTHRGVKAVIQGDTLEYMYQSATGKSINSALFQFDREGNFVGYLVTGSYSATNSPRLFSEKLLEKMKKSK